MLKNKEERRCFLEKNNNWKLVYQLKDLGLRYYKMDFSDDTSLIRIDRLSKDYVTKKDEWSVENYRKLENGKVDYNFYSINYCVDYIMKRELKEPEKEQKNDEYELQK